MHISTFGWSAVSGGAGSLVTGYVLKLIEHRREARRAGSLEIERRRAAARFEAIRAIRGHSRQLYHYLSHIVHDPLLTENYTAAARDSAALMRTLARAEVEVVGEAYVRAVHNVTDNAMRLIEARERDPAEALALAVRYELGFPGNIHNSWFDVMASAAIPEMIEPVAVEHSSS